MLDRVARALAAANAGGGVRGRRLLAAVSGGLDSTVLAHALAGLRESCGFELAIGHVDHGLRGEASEADARAVEALATELGARFACERVDPSALREGRSSRDRPTLQEAARVLRRDALEQMRTALDCQHVVTAHQADDQAETVLLRLLRGSGPDGLGGIPEASVDGVVLRPLLAITREEIGTWARERKLAWREDASNTDPRYARNRLRHEVLPGLRRDFNPRLLRVLGDLAEAQRRENEWLEAQVREEAEKVVRRELDGTLRLSATGWRDRPEALARRLVRLALRESGLGRDLSRTHLLRTLDFLRDGRVGTTLELPGGARLLARREHFLLSPASEG